MRNRRNDVRKHAAPSVENIWDRFLTDRDKKVFAASGAGRRIGFGDRPALFIIDVSYSFLGEQAEPVLDSIKRWRLSCGEEGWAGVAVIRKLLLACRAKGLPIIYSTGDSASQSQSSGIRALKNWRIGEDRGSEERGNEIVRDIRPEPGDIVIKKSLPSAFFRTPLLDHLINLKVDSLLVTGAVTSNCVRATVVDAFSHNFKCTVIADACFDRLEAPHAISLFDMNAKFADVEFSAEVLRYVESVPAGPFPASQRDATHA